MLTLLGYLLALEVRQEGVGSQAEVSAELMSLSFTESTCLLPGHQISRGKRMPEKLDKEATIGGSTTDLRERVYVTVPR